MRGLPLGMYIPGESILHRTRPLVKILMFLILMIAVLVNESFLGYGILFLFCILLILISRIRVAVVLATSYRMSWFFVLVFVMNLCFYGPENPWISVGFFQPSYEGFVQGMHIVVRMCYLLILTNLLTITTAPIALTKGIEQLISPLAFIGVPVEQIAMMLSIAIQFIPILLEETEMIKKAQIARGARFDSPKLLDKAKSVLPLVVPIFLAAFKRADELSLAMEARGYRMDRKKNKKREE